MFTLLNLDLLSNFITKTRRAWATKFGNRLIQNLIDYILILLFFTLYITPIGIFLTLHDIINIFESKLTIANLPSWCLNNIAGVDQLL